MAVARYDITVDGELAPEYAGAFAPHLVSTGRGTSTIHTDRLDDAALLALLGRVSDLAISLVRIERLDRR